MSQGVLWVAAGYLGDIALDEEEYAMQLALAKEQHGVDHGSMNKNAAFTPDNGQERRGHEISAVRPKKQQRNQKDHSAKYLEREEKKKARRYM